MVGFDLIRRISERLYSKTGVGPDQVQLIELHDCFAPNELITYEALGLCPIGKAGEIVDKGDNTYGGKWVINPSGGLISKGHPIGATGIAQAVELSNQLRGRCGLRQVPNTLYALQHNIGIGGAGVVALYKLAFPELAKRGGEMPANEGNGQFKSDAIFEEIKERAAKESDLAKQIGASYKFVINSTNGEKREWTVDLKCSPPFVGIGEGGAKPEVEIMLSDEMMIELAKGKMKPDQAFMQGKMKIRGNIMKAMKLKHVLDPSKLKAKI